jgi:acyl-CoA synthetase (AMP-forming)/AMP-acid ligase II
MSNRLANVFVARGLRRGDRVGVLLSQSVEAALAHVAAWKAGLVSIPLFTLFGEDALEFRLADSGARVVVTDTVNLGKVEAIRARLPNLKWILVVGVGRDGSGLLDFWPAVERASDAFTPVEAAGHDAEEGIGLASSRRAAVRARGGTFSVTPPLRSIVAADDPSSRTPDPVVVLPTSSGAVCSGVTEKSRCARCPCRIAIF